MLIRNCVLDKLNHFYHFVSPHVPNELPGLASGLLVDSAIRSYKPHTGSGSAGVNYNYETLSLRIDNDVRHTAHLCGYTYIAVRYNRLVIMNGLATLGMR